MTLNLETFDLAKVRASLWVGSRSELFGTPSTIDQDWKTVLEDRSKKVKVIQKWNYPGDGFVKF